MDDRTQTKTNLQDLRTHLDKLDRAAKRFDDRLASSTVPRIAPVG